MKQSGKPPNNSPQFKSIAVGEAFLLKGGLFMRVSPLVTAANVVSLSSGFLYVIEDKALVTPLPNAVVLLDGEPS
jgi:hypothetical protein